MRISFPQTPQMLAQCLVRKLATCAFRVFSLSFSIGRELFPTSDCLKASQREKLLYDEITASEADVICLQVSRLLLQLSLPP